MCVFHHAAGQGDILLKGQVRAVNHDRGKAAVNHRFAGFKIRAMVQMDYNIQVTGFYSSLNKLHQVGMVGVLARTGRYLQDQGRVLLLGALNDALDDFHVVDVERSDRIAAFIRFFKHFPGID